MPPNVEFHLGLHCLTMHQFAGFQNEKDMHVYKNIKL